MKKTIGILIAFLLFASCNQNNTPQPNNNSGNNNGGNGNGNGNSVASAHWIPNWQNDTLVGSGSNPNATDPYDNMDVIYTIKKGDTSIIQYHGSKYYIWAQCPYTTPNNYPNWFEDNSKSYVWIYIGVHPFDMSSTITGSALCGVTPPKYYNEEYNTWHTQDFVIMINPLKPPFPEWVYMGFYTSANKWWLPH
ncbi:MAG TPA: hypothetical protein VFL76_03825 [Edaphocola sp.]|nr:hypothetical protein [Edaphocola sp.]